LEGGAGAPQMARRPGEPGCAQPLACEQGGAAAQAYTGIVSVAIGRVVDPSLAGGSQDGSKTPTWYAEKRPQQTAIGAFAQRCDTGEPVEAAAPSKAHEQRLGLVL